MIPDDAEASKLGVSRSLSASESDVSEVDLAVAGPLDVVGVKIAVDLVYSRDSEERKARVWANFVVAEDVGDVPGSPRDIVEDYSQLKG